MKIASKFFALALVAVTTVFASCSKDDDSAQKGAENFSHDIIGMWEGVERTGDDADGNAEARIAYFADGTYIYYHKVADVWFPRSDDASEYNIEGNKLTSRWKPGNAENYSSEWWNIDAIKDGMMKWSARRENKDGSQYTATFTWKKVNDTLTSEQIMAKLSGTWLYYDMKQTTLLKGEVIESNQLPWIPQATYTFTNDGKYLFAMPAMEGSTEKQVTEHTYTIKGNVLCTFTKKSVTADGKESDEVPLNGKIVINAISDDQLVLFEYGEIPEELVVFENFDAFLGVVYLKRVE